MLQVKHINEQIVLGILNLKLFSDSKGAFKQRELEKAGTLVVLKHLFNDEQVELGYDNQGKPYVLNTSEHISISHSHDYVVVIKNKEQTTGCDIELIRDKVVAIQHKFLRPSEQACANGNVEKLITYWAAKETLYKVYGLKQVDFNQNLSVEDFADNKIIGKITINQYNKGFLLQWEKIDNYILVYCLHEI